MEYQYGIILAERIAVTLEKDRIMGSILGLALGDAFGAPYEGGVLERFVWTLLGTQDGKLRWTDDTQMTIDVIESLLAEGEVHQGDLAQRFAKSYQWSRGYGPSAAKVLKQIRGGQPWESACRSSFPEGSFGNGGAMRAPVIGLFYARDSEESLCNVARKAAAVTHAHALGQEGAALIALATALAYKDEENQTIINQLCCHAASIVYGRKLQQVKNWLDDSLSIEPRVVVSELGNGIAATDSCITAIYIALAFRKQSFDELLGFVIKLGGDVDTIAAMAGAIWGAARGLKALPRAKLDQLEQCSRLEMLAESLATAISS